eukprot:s1268_g6.t2
MSWVAQCLRFWPDQFHFVTRIQRIQFVSCQIPGIALSERDNCLEVMGPIRGDETCIVSGFTVPSVAQDGTHPGEKMQSFSIS